MPVRTCRMVLHMAHDFRLSLMEAQGPATDRRLASNHILTVLVDLGLTYQKTHGDAVARQFYASRGIPDELAARVLSRQQGRRTVKPGAAPRG